MKPRKTLSAYVLLVGVMGLSIVGGIFAYQIFAAATKSQVSTAQKEAIKPLEGTINQKAIDNLTKRVVFSDSEISTPLVTIVSPSITPTPSSTGSATTVQ